MHPSRWIVSLAAVFVFAEYALASITVTGSDADKQKWQAMIDQCRARSTYFKNFYDGIANNATKSISVILVNGDTGTWIDSFCSNKVDVADLLDFPELDPPRTIDRCEWIIHILAERWARACHPGWTYAQCHHYAISQTNGYRASLGYPDIIDDGPDGSPGGGIVFRDSTYKEVCIRWKDTTPPPPGTPPRPGTTYVPVPDQNSKGAATVQSSQAIVGGGTRYTWHIDSGEDTLRIPNLLGGGTTTVTGFSGTIVLDVTPSSYTGYDEVRVFSLDTTAPSFPTPAGPTGVNHLSALPLEQGYGVWGSENGQLAVTYTGQIVNDFYPAGTPLRFYSLITAIWHPAEEEVEFHTSAALYDGQPNAGGEFENEEGIGGESGAGISVTVSRGRITRPSESQGVAGAAEVVGRVRALDGSRMPAFDPSSQSLRVYIGQEMTNVVLDIPAGHEGWKPVKGGHRWESPAGDVAQSVVKILNNGRFKIESEGLKFEDGFPTDDVEVRLVIGNETGFEVRTWRNRTRALVLRP